MPRIVLKDEIDWEGWRAATRALVLSGVPPAAITWSVGEPTEPIGIVDGSFSLPRSLVELAEEAIQARDPERFGLLYSLVWRAHRGERQLLGQSADPEVARTQQLARAVRRDSHRMRSFLRFRPVEDPAGTRHVGWWEPEHYVVEVTARAYARRFGAVPWSILTPYRSAHWDGRVLRLGPGLDGAEVADDEALDAYWRAAGRGNQEAAMAVPDWIHRVADRVEVALEADVPSPDRLPLGTVRARSRESGPAAAATPLGRAAKEAEHCRRCQLWEPATQTVFGEGPGDARIMMIGEQPGDQEDQIGRPFVGPAGQLLDRALEEAGIDRRTVYVTNAVKHFKFERRGKRRIHQKPETPEIVACRYWLDMERVEVKPELLVLLGATAARAVLERPVTIGRERGMRIPLTDRLSAFVTVHPSYLLRLPDPASKEREYRAFVADLKKAARILG
jgi:uracil-DNA glycosylase family protein